MTVRMPAPPKDTQFLFELRDGALVCHVIPAGDPAKTLLATGRGETYAEAAWDAKREYETRRMGRRPFVR